MSDTAARTLALLSLFQSRPDWTGSELATRLGVSDRTIRNDITRLRALGYPVDAVRGPGGRYRLGVGGKLPPLLFDDEEAVAVVIGLGAAGAITGVEDSSARALSKFEQVMPDRIRRRITALREASSAGPVNTASNVEDPPVDAGLLSDLAAAIRDHHGIRCFYREEPIELDPYHLVAWQRRWFLVGRDVRTAEWAPYRVDWLTLRIPGGRPFNPVPPPFDVTEFVVREVARTGWAVHARILVEAAAQDVIDRINPAVGTVEALGPERSVLITGGDSLETVAVWIGMLGYDFTVEDQPDLVDHLRTLAERYARAVPSSPAR